MTPAYACNPPSALILNLGFPERKTSPRHRPVSPRTSPLGWLSFSRLVWLHHGTGFTAYAWRIGPVDPHNARGILVSMVAVRCAYAGRMGNMIRFDHRIPIALRVVRNLFAVYAHGLSMGLEGLGSVGAALRWERR
jgi:hypothetical protein